VWVIKDHPGIEVSTGLHRYDRLGAERALLSYLANKHWGQQQPVGRKTRAATRRPTAAHDCMSVTDNVVPLADRVARWKRGDFS
jgi:hypothetical protein